MRNMDTSEDRAVTIALVIATALALLRVFRATRGGEIDGEFALAMAFLLIGAYLLASELRERFSRHP